MNGAREVRYFRYETSTVIFTAKRGGERVFLVKRESGFLKLVKRENEL